ncbi:sensor histidine kinase [Permianibacter aggregans]|uniref:histidine kinase n=1 Tax=Permianibacter aggregans TaxID=1510150 RepID=A0A4R6UQ54_9GAMM|nr:ATP-binding protein [Permianibacter aggregans]QGX40488.1 hypothetical protein E2H98_12735 [Permianibacter aggregans]TDQ49370.1 histidine kinase/DNA gyrase B/HSP90-like ATPase [Permianibacter aggregans]
MRLNSAIVIKLLHHRWLPAIVAGVVLLLSIVNGINHWLNAKQPGQREFSFAVQERLYVLDQRLDMLTDALKDYRTLLQAVPRVDRSVVEQFGNNLLERYPEIRTLSVSDVYSAQRTEQLVQISRQRGQPVITDVEHSDAPVLDMSRLNFYDERDQRLRILPASDGESSERALDLFLPVFYLAEQRHSTALLSVVHMRIDIGKSFAIARQPLPRVGIDYLLFDDQRQLMQSFPARTRAQVPASSEWPRLMREARYKSEYAFLVGGLNWMMVAISTDDAFNISAWHLWFEPLLGLLLALAIFAIARYWQRLYIQKQQQAELFQQRWRQEQLHAKHMDEELTHLTYILAHDFRAPLRHLRSYPHIALEELGEQINNEARTALTRIAETADKLGKLMDDLLKFSRIGRSALKPKVINLSAIASASYLAVKKRYPEAESQLRCTPELMVWADPELMRIVLDELFDNGFKYTAHRLVAEFAFGVDFSTDTAAFFVRDNGEGIQPAEINRLFQPFNQVNAEDRFGGRGIGLAIVRRVIERHGGRCWIESKPEQQTSIYFTLPAQN